MNEESSSLMWTQQQSDFEATEKTEQPECTFSQPNTGASTFEPPPTTPLDPTLAAILKQMQLQTEALLAVTARPVTIQSIPKPPQLPPIQAGPQGEDEILRFEKHMQVYSIPTTKWAAELRTLLRGDLTDASLSIPAEHADSYEALKTALLTRMGVTTASRFELWFEPKPKGNETMAQVFHRTLDIGIACLKECESMEECAKLVTTELMYKLVATNISALIRAQKPANTTEFVQAADLYISGSRLDRSKLWDQRGGRQHFTPYRYPFKEQQPSSPQNTIQTIESIVPTSSLTYK